MSFGFRFQLLLLMTDLFEVVLFGVVFLFILAFSATHSRIFYLAPLFNNVFESCPLITYLIVSVPVLRSCFPTSEKLCFSLAAKARIKLEIIHLF